jgi:hypothetical protein
MDPVVGLTSGVAPVPTETELVEKAIDDESEQDAY